MFGHFCRLDSVHIFSVFKHDCEVVLTLLLIHHHDSVALRDNVSWYYLSATENMKA